MSELSYLLSSWVLAAIVLFYMLSKKRVTSGLPLAYTVGLFMIHWPGAAIYLVDGYYFNNPDIVLIGFRLTTLALWSFIVGVWLGGVRKGSGVLCEITENNTYQLSAYRVTFTARALFLSGLVIQLLVAPLIGGVATITAILSGLSALSVVGVCLGIYAAYMHGNKRQLRIWLLIAIMFPMITLTTSAFVGYGIHSLVVVLAFFLTRYRLNAIRLFSLFIAAYMGISFFVTYASQRDVIRQTIWYEQAGYGDRFETISGLFTDFEFFDSENINHLVSIDQRLNQNWLVGSASAYVGSGYKDLAYGETILFSLVALIPRAVWPDKPVVGGGGDLVTEYTGIKFATGTSVGAGQVLEFYINFGTLGVLLGFVILGIAIRQFDVRAASALSCHDYRKFIIWFLPGLGFLQAGGNLVEVTTTVGASIFGAIIVGKIVRRKLDKKQTKNINYSYGQTTS